MLCSLEYDLFRTLTGANTSSKASSVMDPPELQPASATVSVWFTHTISMTWRYIREGFGESYLRILPAALICRCSVFILDTSKQTGESICVEFVVAICKTSLGAWSLRLNTHEASASNNTSWSFAMIAILLSAFKYINTHLYIVKMIVHKPKKTAHKLTKHTLFTSEKYCTFHMKQEQIKINLLNSQKLKLFRYKLLHGEEGRVWRSQWQAVLC